MTEFFNNFSIKIPPLKKLFTIITLSVIFIWAIVLVVYTDENNKIKIYTDHALASNASTSNKTSFEKAEQTSLIYLPLRAKVDKLTACQEISVNVTINKKSFTFQTTPKKVENILQDCNIKLAKEDIVIPSKTSTAKDNTTIEIKKVTTKATVTTQPLKYTTEVVYTTSLKPGQSKITQKGKEGLQEVTKTEYYVNGVLDKKKTKTTSKVVKSPVNSVKQVGGSNLNTISPLNYGPIVNGLPKNATLYKRGATATAYTAAEGARTSTGRVAQVGYVAVNPKKIPYGTKLYIVSNDGRYIYGYALAADTGGALMSGQADVDLYFNTNSECIRFGRRPVNIYIVK